MNTLLILTLLVTAQAPADNATAPAPVEGTTVAESEQPTTPEEGAEESPEGESTEPVESSLDASNSPIISTLKDIFGSGAIGLLLKGGVFMWPILIMGVIAAGVIIERYRSLKMLSTDSSALRQEVHRLLLADQVEEALGLCDREQGPVPAILSAGLRKYFVLRRLNYDASKIREQVIKAMDDYSIHVVAALERHLPILATISSVAPMLGFLGTVAGMITSFDDIVAKMGEMNIVEAAAGGISVALLTTAFGLIIGIPAFMAFNYFTSVINRFVLDVEESATELIEAVTLQMALGEAPASASQAAPAETEYSAGG